MEEIISLGMHRHKETQEAVMSGVSKGQEGELGEQAVLLDPLDLMVFG